MKYYTVETFPKLPHHHQRIQHVYKSASSHAASCGLVLLWQGTVNGIGERTGNANLMTIIPTMQLKMGIVGVAESLRNLTALSRFSDEQVSLT